MSRRALAGRVVVVVWLAAVAWQARSVYLQPEATRLAEASRSLDPTTYFYAVRMGGDLVGLATSRLDTVPEGFLLEERLNLELVAMAEEGSASATTTVRLTPSLRMSDFAFGLSSDAGSFTASGEVEGDSLLHVEVDGGGEPERLSFRFAEPPLSAAALPIRIALGGELREGRTLRIRVFDPSTVSTRTVEVEVLERDTLMLPDSVERDPSGERWIPSGPRPVTVWLLEQRWGGVALQSWIDEDGRLVRSSSPTGLSLERMPFELIEQERDAGAMRGRGSRPGTDVVLSTAIASDLDPERVNASDELRFVLSGMDLDGFHLDGGRQALRGDTLVVRRERWSELEAGYSLPYPRMDLAAALRPEPLVQSGDERIIETARRWARGGRDDPVRTARLLAEAVHGAMDPAITFSLPSARQVLETLRGDCNEHTVLYVALARALGLPARSAVGLVYLEGAFYYHAWPEVWLGEWVAVDPTFGDVPAGAAHLRFVTGGLAQQVEVARLIGNLRIHAVDS